MTLLELQRQVNFFVDQGYGIHEVMTLGGYGVLVDVEQINYNRTEDIIEVVTVS